ncbi:DNA-binding MarR family transcriptional regulator [Bradyrhizobium sp. i1.8.4]|uniref:MarR family winged helix-turn-helix transcriptional regulator n=1 Tax=unclassified Bradyrhizobium TaxID=2631580 RepID=UPI003D23BBD8
MTEKLRTERALPPEAIADAELAPVTAMMSSRLMVLANLLRRGAMLRYKRVTGLSSVEFGLIVSLGRRPPMSVVRLADAVGMDKGQISRALAVLVERKLVSKASNPHDNRETLISLTKAGLAAHDAIVAGAQERNRRLLEQLDPQELELLLGHIDRLTATAAEMLAAERELG